MEREMPEDLDLDEINPDEHDNPNLVRQLRDGYKQTAKELKEARGAQRELAFVKAGVDTDSPLGKVLMKGYDGKDDVDAIKAAWAELNPQPVAPVVVEEVAATQEGVAGAAPAATTPAPEPTGSAERRSLAEGAAPGGAPAGDARGRILEEALKEKETGRFEDVAGGFVNRLVNGYATGEIQALGRSGRRQGE